MRKQDLDTAQQALEAALRNLRESRGNAGTEWVVGFQGEGPSSAEGADVRVIVLVAGEANTNSQDRTASSLASVGDTASPESAGGCGCDNKERKLSHPGLERFTIENDSPLSVPKRCFMEPDRTCVNSGACEMRGF